MQSDDEYQYMPDPDPDFYCDGPCHRLFTSAGRLRQHVMRFHPSGDQAAAYRAAENAPPPIQARNANHQTEGNYTQEDHHELGNYPEEFIGIGLANIDVIAATTRPYPGAARPIGDPTPPEWVSEGEDWAWWRPFSCPEEFQDAVQHIKHQDSTERITEALKSSRWKPLKDQNGDPIDRSFNTGVGLYDLWHNTWEEFLPRMSSTRMKTIYGREDTGLFWHRNLIDTVECFLKQPCYAEGFSTEPILATNEAGERLYSDFNTANWWHRKQVISAPLCGLHPLIHDL